jgi:hypothetical protein
MGAMCHILYTGRSAQQQISAFGWLVPFRGALKAYVTTRRHDERTAGRSMSRTRRVVAVEEAQLLRERPDSQRDSWELRQLRCG